MSINLEIEMENLLADEQFFLLTDTLLSAKSFEEKRS